jgi:glutaredoxin-related protein|tara:strand:+ start:483 stop:698 length:216 start_codon:yes stop_codon:yes gene_type:complete
MDKQFYRSLLLLVNTKDHMDLLHKYVSARIDHFHQQLESTKDHQRVLEIQGSIAELRRFKTLRDEVIKGAE